MKHRFVFDLVDWVDPVPRKSKVKVAAIVAGVVIPVVYVDPLIYLFKSANMVSIGQLQSECLDSCIGEEEKQSERRKNSRNDKPPAKDI